MPSNAGGNESQGRIPMLERDAVAPEIAAMYDALLKQRGVVPNMFKTIAQIPAMAQGFAAFLKPIVGDGALPGWYKELIATRMSVLNKSTYAISAHSLSAKQKGASDAQVEAAKSDFESGPFTEAEKLGFRFAERVHRSGGDVDDQMFRELKAVYSDQQLIELTAAAAAFEFFPRFVDALRIPTTPIPASAIK
jgi:AhpD family alkylhydroperoxidase